MAQSSFFQRFGWHLFFWIVILSLAGWIVWEKVHDRSRLLNEATVKTMIAARQIVNKHCAQTKSEISNLAGAYPNEKKAKFDLMARHADQMVDKFNGQLNAMKSQLLNAKSARPGQNVLHPDQITWLQKETSLLRDSLISLVSNDPAITTSIPDFLLSDTLSTENWLPVFLSTSKQDEALLALENIMTRTEEAKSIVLHYFSSQGCIIDIVFDAFTPMISAKNAAPRVGELYEADIFLATYTSQPDNIRIRVNDQELSVKDGVAHFNYRCTEPGEKLKTVIIQTKNPLTQEVKSYVKDFSIHVLPVELK